MKILGRVWAKAVKMSNIIGGLTGSGVWSIDRQRIRFERLVGSNVDFNAASPCPSTSAVTDNTGEKNLSDYVNSVSPVVAIIREMFASIPAPDT